MKNIITGALAVALGLVLGLSVSHFSAPAALKNVGNETAQVKWNQAATSTGIVVGNTSVRLLATSTSRTWAMIVNDSSCPIFLNLNGDRAAISHLGILVASSSSFTINTTNLYSGSIQAVSPCSAASTTVYSN